MSINLRYNGIRPDNVVAEHESKTNGGSGDRKVTLSGWGKTEVAARDQLLEQAKAVRDEMNVVIEDMIEKIIAARAS